MSFCASSTSLLFCLRLPRVVLRVDFHLLFVLSKFFLSLPPPPPPPPPAWVSACMGNSKHVKQNRHQTRRHSRATQKRHRFLPISRGVSMCLSFLLGRRHQSVQIWVNPCKFAPSFQRVVEWCGSNSAAEKFIHPSFGRNFLQLKALSKEWDRNCVSDRFSTL